MANEENPLPEAAQIKSIKVTAGEAGYLKLEMEIKACR